MHWYRILCFLAAYTSKCMWSACGKSIKSCLSCFSNVLVLPHPGLLVPNLIVERLHKMDLMSHIATEALEWEQALLTFNRKSFLPSQCCCFLFLLKLVWPLVWCRGWWKDCHRWTTIMVHLQLWFYVHRDWECGKSGSDLMDSQLTRRTHLHR